MTFSEDDLDILIAVITTDANDKDEQLWAFQAAMEDLNLPVDAQVVGEKVDLLQVHYDGNPRRGLVAVCKRKGRKHIVSLVDVVVGDGVAAKRVAAYRRWLGVDPLTDEKLTGRQAVTELADPDAPVEAVLLKVGQNSARIRLLGIHEEVTLRAKRVWANVPGQILTIKPRKRWRHNNYPCMSGEITAARIDIPAVGLEPIGVECLRVWDPSDAEPYVGELADLWNEITAKGARNTYEIERVMPGFDPDRDEMTAVNEANRLYLAGDRSECRDILANVLMKDLRCIEAHMLLGAWEQEVFPHQAVLHFEVAVAIIDHAFGPNFDGVIPWEDSGNKSVIVTLGHYAQCLWQLGRVDEAKAVFERLLWVNPYDPINVRARLLDIRAGKEWGEQTLTEFD